MRLKIAILLIVLLQAYSLTATAQSIEPALEELATSGDIEAQLKIAQAYQYGLGVEKDRVEAIRWYEAAAEQSSPLAMFELGSLVFADFTTVGDNPDAKVAAEKSVEWFHSAADLGFAGAQSTLGLLYGFGDRVEIDRVKGRMWMEVGITNGDTVLKMMKRALEKQMSDEELALALRRAETCIGSSYINCD